jgi:hypothetical protein
MPPPPNMVSLYMECMNSLHARRIAGEGWQGSRFIAPEEEAAIILLGIERGDLRPGQVGRQVAPDPLDRVPLGALRGLAESTHVLREGELGGGVRPPMVPQEDMQAIREGLGQGRKEELAHGRIERGPFEAEALPRGGFDRPIDREPVADMLDAPDRLDAACGETPPPDGPYPHTALIRAQHPDGAPVRWWDHPREWRMTGGLERRKRLGLLWCDEGAPRGAWRERGPAPSGRALCL